MNTASQQVFIAKMADDCEPEVQIRKQLLQPADPDDLDQRGIYQVQVTVSVK